MHRKKFRMDGVTDACCPLCYLEDEDIVHMLIRCPSLNEVRITNSRNVSKLGWVQASGQDVSETLIPWFN